MTETFIAKTQDLLSTLDGFRVEVDLEKQRADIYAEKSGSPGLAIQREAGEQMEQRLAELANSSVTIRCNGCLAAGILIVLTRR